MENERGFLQAILQRPDDDALKLVYADWLEEHGDPRAEYLRLIIRTRQDRAVTPEQRKRHKELSAELVEARTRQFDTFMAEIRAGSEIQGNTPLHQRTQNLERGLADLSEQMRQSIPTRLQELAMNIDTTWLALVSDPEIEGCGRSAGNDFALRFEFLCDRTWADMQPTEDTDVRHCATCSKNVYYCDNLADAREQSSNGHCIAVDVGIVRRDGDLNPPTLFLGRPSKQELRETYEEDLDSVSRARLDLHRKLSASKMRESKVGSVSADMLARPQPAKKITQIAH